MSENWGKFKYTDNGYLILRTIETYEQTDSGKGFKRKPSEVEREVVSPEYYTNYVSAIPFFNNFGDGAYSRGVRSYTCAGYLPTTVTTVSPFREVKKIAKFRFISKSDLESKAGWREKTVMENAKEFESEKYVPTNVCYGIAERITFITEDEGVTHSATWDNHLKRWVD